MASLETVTKPGANMVIGDTRGTTAGLLGPEERTASLTHITQVPLAPEQPESFTNHLHLCLPPFKFLLDEQRENMVTCSDWLSNSYN